MPYSRSSDPDGRTTRFVAWPHTSLSRRGFAAFIIATWALFMIPTLAFLGSFALWGLLPFILLAMLAMWFFLERSYRAARMTETLTMSPDHIHLLRSVPGKTNKEWSANPYWVDVSIHPTGGPVENYLTLRGNGRTVEFGAFLSPDERLILKSDVTETLAALRFPKA